MANLNLDNDSYLIIVYGKDKDKVKIKEYDTKVKTDGVNLLNSPISSAITKVVMAGYTSPIVQNLASKHLSSAVLGRINSSIYDIMADGKVSVQEVAEDFVGSLTNSLDNIATDLGFPTPSALYSAIMPTGSGVISKDFGNLLAKKMNKDNQVDAIKANEGEVSVLKLKIVTSDKETWSNDIPTRKTEKGFEIATAISNNNKTKDFEVVLANNSKAETEMYQLKSQLEEIRDSKETFDVYINDKDVLNQYKLTNCLFSNLDFTPSGTNVINCSLSLVEVPEWNVEIVKLDNNSSKKSKGSNIQGNKARKTKAGIKQSVKNIANKAKTSSKQIQTHSYPYNNTACKVLLKQFAPKQTNQELWQTLRNNGYHEYNTQDLQAWRDKGLIPQYEGK